MAPRRGDAYVDRADKSSPSSTESRHGAPDPLTWDVAVLATRLDAYTRAEPS